MRSVNIGATIPGGSDISINFMGFLTFVLSRSDFPILLFEKSLIDEIQDKQKILLLNQISERINNSKQIFVTLHPDDGLLGLNQKVSNAQVFSCQKNFFKIDF